MKDIALKVDQVKDAPLRRGATSEFSPAF